MNLHANWHLDRLRRICSAHGCHQHADRQICCINSHVWISLIYVLHVTWPQSHTTTSVRASARGIDGQNQSTPWCCQSSRWQTGERAELHRDTESWRSSTEENDATCHRAQGTTGRVDDTAADSLDTHRHTQIHTDRHTDIHRYTHTDRQTMTVPHRFQTKLPLCPNPALTDLIKFQWTVAAVLNKISKYGNYTHQHLSFLPRDAMPSLCVCLCVCVCHTPVLYQNG